jgi:hypothetical protein
MGKKDAIDDILIPLININRLGQFRPASSTFLDPSKEENEAINWTFDWFL